MDEQAGLYTADLWSGGHFLKIKQFYFGLITLAYYNLVVQDQTQLYVHAQ